MAYEDRARFCVGQRSSQELHLTEIADWIVRESGSVRAKAEFELAITIRSLREAAAMPSQAQGLVLPDKEQRSN